MKQLLLTLLLALVAVVSARATDEYTLSASTCTTTSGDELPLTFSNGFSISTTTSKTYQSANGGIKYSAGLQYTIHIPDDIEIVYVEFSGYCNYAGADAYLGELGGVSYGESDYVWPQKDSDGNSTTVSYGIELSEAATDTLTFTPMVYQVVWTIKLYDYIPADPEDADTKIVYEDYFSTPESQMEALDRGLVVLRADGAGRFISWRMLGTDDLSTTWDLLADSVLLESDLTVTNYQHKTGGKTTLYQVVTKVDGEPVDTTEAVSAWDNNYYLPVQLDLPEDGYTSDSSSTYSYTPNDCTVGDVDGDGQYEIVVKWDPSNSKDNSNTGETGPVIIDCYKIDGTQLWRINLGPNIRAGAHYTQMVFYDLSGDGKPELLVKTAPGATDSEGNYVSSVADDSDITGADNTADYRNSDGRILSGPEWLTVFDGLTGEAIHTVFYNPNRAGYLGGAPDHPEKSFWNDNYGNRADRHLACAAYLDGPDENPSAVFCRGYYTRAYLWAVDFDGEKLSTKWLHASTSKTSVTLTDADDNSTTTTYSSNTSGLSTSYTAYGQGNHNLSVGDVDGDGCDEIVWGSCAIDNDGSLLYSVGYGHGDAMHLGKLNPNRKGLQVFDVHEESNLPYGWDVHDAATGEVYYYAEGSSDNARGMSGDIYSSPRGYEFWSNNDHSPRSAVTGETVASISPSACFRLYWDGDLLDDLFDGSMNTSTGISSPVITKGTGVSLVELYAKNYGYSQSCNYTKATPCLTADLFGDWREEVVCWNYNDPSQLIILTTNITSSYAIPTLMHDHTYRMGVVWENVAYNQPPHTGYYLPDYVEYLTELREEAISTGISVTPADQTSAAANSDPYYYTLSGMKLSAPNAPGIYIHQGRKIWVR